MATAQTRSTAQPSRRARGRAAPWIAFVLGVALAIGAVAAWFMLFRANPPTSELAPITVEAPRLPDINLPDQPILPRG